RYAEAQTWVSVAVQTAADDDLEDQILTRTLRAKLLAQRREFREAEHLAREAVERSEPMDWLNLRADALMDLAEVLRLSTRTRDAARAAQRACRLYVRKGNTVSAREASMQLEALKDEMLATTS